MLSDEFEDLRALAEQVARAQGAGMWAEDIAASSMERYWEHKDEVRNARAWVRRTARNLAIDRARRDPDAGWARLPGEGTLAHAPLPRQLQGRGPSGSLAARDQLHRALDVLDDIERELLVGQNEGYGLRELAERLGYTEASVRTKLSVARRKIRDAFPDLDIN